MDYSHAIHHDRNALPHTLTNISPDDQKYRVGVTKIATFLDSPQKCFLWLRTISVPEHLEYMYCKLYCLVVKI